MDVVGVRDVVAVRDALHDAETLLQALGELVGRRFERRAVERIVDILRGFPLRGEIVEFAHDGQTQLLAFRLGELVPRERIDALPKAGVAERHG